MWWMISSSARKVSSSQNSCCYTKFFCSPLKLQYETKSNQMKCMQCNKDPSLNSDLFPDTQAWKRSTSPIWRLHLTKRYSFFSWLWLSPFIQMSIRCCLYLHYTTVSFKQIMRTSGKSSWCARLHWALFNAQQFTDFIILNNVDPKNMFNHIMIYKGEMY